MKWLCYSSATFFMALLSVGLPAHAQSETKLPFSIYNREAPALTYEDGLAAFEADDFKRATDIWKPLADAGNTDAQLMLGVRYFEGRGVFQSNITALHWIRKSATAGNLEAMRTLNILHSMEPALGITSEENYRWKLERAKRGDPLAQNMIARKFSEKKDYKNARIWHEKAAAQGDKDSIQALRELDAVDGFTTLLDNTVSTSGAQLGAEKFPVFVDTELNDVGDVAATCSVALLHKYDSETLPVDYLLLVGFYDNPQYNGGLTSEHAETQYVRHLMTSAFSPDQGPSAKYCEENAFNFIENRVAEQ